MAKRDLTQVAVGVALGVLVAMVLGATFFGISFSGGRETRVTLAVENDACKLGKETTVKAKAGKDLSWKIENYCLSNQQVSVGDFRTAATSKVNCDNPGDSYPFEQRDGREVTITAGEMRDNGTIKPGKGQIKLKVNKHDNAAITSYYFNICLGGTPADPRLLVER